VNRPNAVFPSKLSLVAKADALKNLSKRWSQSYDFLIYSNNASVVVV
jgi:hypothetical protein